MSSSLTIADAIVSGAASLPLLNPLIVDAVNAARKLHPPQSHPRVATSVASK